MHTSYLYSYTLVMINIENKIGKIKKNCQKE